MFTTPYQDPNQTLATRRQELGLTPAELGSRVGYEVNLAGMTIQLIESGRAHIPLRRCRQFAAALRVDEMWFTLCLLRNQMPEVADVIEGVIARQRSAS